MHEPDSTETTGRGPSKTLIGVATIVGLLALMVAISSGVGAAFAVLGLAVFVIGLIAVVRGGAHWARIVGRRAAAVVAVAGFIAMGLGSAMTPSTATENTAAEAAAPSTSATPSTKAPKSTAAAKDTSAKPLVAAPAPITSQAPALPPAPVMALTCPQGGTVANPVFGQQISAAAPYTVTINYGDGDSYTNDHLHLGAIFSHAYRLAGTFTVQATLTDAAGQTTSASCTYSWTQPVVAPAPPANNFSSGGSGGAVSGGGSGGVSTGGGSSSAGGAPYYQNCDAVRAAGADPIHAGDPGWQPKFDRDGDGTGCE